MTDQRSSTRGSNSAVAIVAALTVVILLIGLSLSSCQGVNDSAFYLGTDPCEEITPTPIYCNTAGGIAAVPATPTRPHHRKRCSRGRHRRHCVHRRRGGTAQPSS